MLRYPADYIFSGQVGAWGSNADFTQSYFLSGTDLYGAPLKFDFIGRYENLHAGWQKIQGLLGVELPNLEVNNSSGPSNLKHELAEMAVGDTETSCLVCKLYLQDYAC